MGRQVSAVAAAVIGGWVNGQAGASATGGYEFQITSLRRADEGKEDPAAAAATLSLRAGVRVARLAAECPAGTRISLQTRAVEGRLNITGRVSATGPLDLSRSGLVEPSAVLLNTAQELSGRLGDWASVSEVTPTGDAAGQWPGPALQVLPRGRGKGLRPAGFLGSPQPDGGVWASPRPSDPEELARLLLANPHVALIQTVEPLDDSDVERAREELLEDLFVSSPHAVGEVIGTPVRVAAALFAVAEPWTLPLRLREHLRGWFDVLDLDEARLDAEPPGDVMPELVAGGMLRLPTATTPSFPGLPVRPAIVPLDTHEPLEHGIRVGWATDLQDRRREVLLDDETMSRHVHIIGESGSGKSTLLAAMALETAARGGGLLMLDPHGSTVDRILRELPASARDRVLLIRCGDTRNPVRLNPFAVSDPDLLDIVISDMLDVFQQLYDPRHEGIVGPRFQHIMRHSLSTLAAVRGPRTSLLDVPRLLSDGDLLNAALRACGDDGLRRFWEAEFLTNRSNDLNEVVAWVSSKFTAFADNRAVQAMLATGADSFDPARAMDADTMILVDLDKSAVGVMGARILGLLYLLRVWVAALGREEPHPFTVLVDEAASFSAVALPAILSEGRKFGLRAVVAHQYSAQLQPALAEAIAGSVATRMIFRVGAEDARGLAVSTYPEFSPLDLSSLPQFTAAARIASTGTAVRPFTLTVDHNDRVRPLPDADEAAAAILQRSTEQLVDPHRDAQPLDLVDLLPGGGGSPGRPGPSRRGPGRRRPEPSLLEEWIARRGGDPDTEDDDD